MIEYRDRVIAGVSGGPDSVFLLHSLGALKRKLRISGIGVCHVDHGLRGKESEGDSLFVRQRCEDMGLTYFEKKLGEGKLRSKDMSIEEAARIERYIFFRESARSFDAGVIATGHTMDDQAETVLMRILKGASLKGLVGILPVRQENGIRIIRPLIQIDKSSIVSYLDRNGIAYRIDSSNLENVYFRNEVRSDIIPFLEKYNPKLKRVLFGLAEHLREDFEFINSEKIKARAMITAHKDGGVEILIKDIVVQPSAIQKEMLRDSLEKAGGDIKKLSYRHWKEMEAVIKRKGRGTSIDLPGSIRMTRTDRALLMRRL